MNKDNDLTEDENSVNSCIYFLAINSIINKVLFYYLLLHSFMQRDFVISQQDTFFLISWLFKQKLKLMLLCYNWMTSTVCKVNKILKFS